jgi:hypothetical protein
MAKEDYYVILVHEDGEIIVSKFNKSDLITYMNMRVDKVTEFVETLDCGECPSDWLKPDDDNDNPSAMLIIKGGKIVVPNITKKVDYHIELE